MKRGFTLIELIFVIIIIGILSAVLAPKFDRPTLRQAANQIVSHIRYTQHLAMVDNKFNPTDEFWYRKRWQIQFQNKKINGENRLLYTIYQDLNDNGSPSTVVSKNEIAKNPLNSKQLLTGLSSDGAVVSKEMILSEKYGIVDVLFSSSCSYYKSRRVSFDYLGRPLYGNPHALDAIYHDNFGATGARLIKRQCIITLIKDSDNNDSQQIAIEPETGYAHIL